MTTLLTPLFAWVAHRVGREQLRDRLIQDIMNVGGKVNFQRDESGNPTDRVARLYLASTELDPSILERLTLLADTAMVSFNCTSISDDDLKYLDGMHRMIEIHLNETKITDKGVNILPPSTI